MSEALIGLLGVVVGVFASVVLERSKQNTIALAAAQSIAIELMDNASKIGKVVQHVDKTTPAKDLAKVGTYWWAGALTTAAWKAGQRELFVTLGRSQEGRDTRSQLSSAYENIDVLNESRKAALQPPDRDTPGPTLERPPTDIDVEVLKAAFDTKLGLQSLFHATPGNGTEIAILPTTRRPQIVGAALAAGILLLALWVLWEPLPYRDSDVATAVQTAIPSTAVDCNPRADGWVCIVYPLGHPSNALAGPSFTELVSEETNPTRLVAEPSPTPAPPGQVQTAIALQAKEKLYRVAPKQTNRWDRLLGH